MIIEQAFHNLPEILVGAGYGRQDYRQGFEASIVAALSLALLQELNGRNAQNPISFLMAEKRYGEASDKLRADLYVDLKRLLVGSAEYASFGFRFHNWVEAKYFRVTKGVPPNTQNLGSIVADLIRLIALPPHEPPSKSTSTTTTGRYFLHVYRGDPLKKKLISDTREDRTKRDWVTKLLLPGSQKIDDLELAKETKWPSFFKHVPDTLSSATCGLQVTNYVIAPTHVPDVEGYIMILTRIDTATFKWNGHEISLRADREFAYSGPNGWTYDRFRKEFPETLKPKKARKVRAKKEPKPPTRKATAKKAAGKAVAKGGV